MTARDAPVEKHRESKTLERKISQFVPVELTADLGSVRGTEVAVLHELIAASKFLDPVFDRQAWIGNPRARAALEEDPTPLGQSKLEYFDIMRGPWDRQDHWKPFATEQERPLGGGFYPEDLSAEAFKAYVAKHPEQSEALTSLTTIVRREGPNLVAVPYSKAFSEWLVPAAQKLREAAELTQNASLKRFLELRADAFASDDYYESDKAWMDLDSRIEVTIGPYEVYEDELLGLKASFESFVTVSDPEASKKLAHFEALLPAMEKNLPIPDEAKTVRGAESPIRVVDVVYTAGDARKSVQTIAFNLPNDERVRKEKGAKKVMLRNVIRAKFDAILAPIGELLIAPEQTAKMSSDAFFNETLFHELSHSLGPAFVDVGGKKVEVRLVLGSDYAAVEEAKADAMGAYNLLYMIERKELPETFRPQLLVTYFAGLLRSVRFGVEEAHGQGAALQLNYFLAKGGARQDPTSGRFAVDLAKLQGAIRELTAELCMLQRRGDTAGVEALLAEHGKLTPPIGRAIAKLTHLPVDVRPVFPLAN
jgi:hypothetical protein